MGQLHHVFGLWPREPRVKLRTFFLSFRSGLVRPDQYAVKYSGGIGGTTGDQVQARAAVLANPQARMAISRRAKLLRARGQKGKGEHTLAPLRPGFSFRASERYGGTHALFDTHKARNGYPSDWTSTTCVKRALHFFADQ